MRNHHRRPARAHIHFVQTAADTTSNPTMRFVDYTVEVRRGQVRYSIGRIYGAVSVNGGRASWMGLPCGQTSGWTRYHTTRRAALLALYAGESCTQPATFVEPARLTGHQAAMLQARHTSPVVGAVRRCPRQQTPARPALALAA